MTFIIRNPAEFKIYLISLYSMAVSQNWRKGSVVNFFFPVHLWFLRCRETSMLLMEKNCGFHPWCPPINRRTLTPKRQHCSFLPKPQPPKALIQTKCLSLLPAPKFSLSQIIKNYIQFQILMEARDGIQLKDSNFFEGEHRARGRWACQSEPAMLYIPQQQLPLKYSIKPLCLGPQLQGVVFRGIPME